jgi:hypothetical protein
MTSKFLSLIAGVAALGLVGAAANAAEPMHLTDAQLDGVTAGSSQYDYRWKKKIDIKVAGDVRVRGNIAEVTAYGVALGRDTLVHIDGYTYTDSRTSVASLEMTSATK